MAPTKPNSIAHVRSEMWTLLHWLVNERPYDTGPLAGKVREIASGTSAKTFCKVAQETGLVGWVAREDAAELVGFLLKTGVDPSIFPDHDGYLQAHPNYPLHLVIADSKQQRACFDLLVAGGASIEALSPPPDTVTTPSWRETALDLAINRGAASLVEALLPRAAQATGEAALLTAIVATKGKKPDRAFLLSLIERLPIAAETRFGMTALHAAALVGDAEIWDRVAARSTDLNPRLPADLSYVGDWLPVWGKGLLLAAGSTPLDMIAPARAMFTNVRVGYDAQKSQGHGNDIARQQIVAQLDAYEALEQRIKAAGGVSATGGGADGRHKPGRQLPEPIARLESAMAPLLAKLGATARWRTVADALDIEGFGPFNYFNAVIDRTPKLFAGLQGAEAHLLGAFLNGSLRASKVLYDLAPEELAEIDDIGDDVLIVEPREYPKSAKRILASGILGHRAGAVIAITKEPAGATLWSLTPSAVTSLGKFVDFVQEGVAALLSQDAAHAPSP
jgi:hypothetical protein